MEVGSKTYAGNWPESYAKTHYQMFYTHTAIVNGKEVRYYDCYLKGDVMPPAFKDDELQKWKVQETRNELNTVRKWWRWNGNE